MRKALIALSLTTVAFAASTAYLARELRLERANTATKSTMTSASGTPLEVTQAPKPAAQLSATLDRAAAPAQPASTTSVMGIPADLEARIKADQQTYYRQFVERFDDPEERAQMVAEFKAMIRNTNPGLAQALNLSKEDAERLMDAMALEQAGNQATYARCYLNPPCESEKLLQTAPNPATQAITNLLGPEGSQKYDQYQSSAAERETVTAFDEMQDELLIATRQELRQKRGYGAVTFPVGN